jgi:adenylate cyclase
MAATVVPAARTVTTFEEAFGQEVLRSERLRTTIVIVLIAVIFVRWFVLWTLFPVTVAEQLGDAVHINKLAILGTVALVYELGALYRMTRMLRRGQRIPMVLRYINAFVEVSIPTLAMLVVPEVTSPVYALYTPPSWVYFVFIILSTLRLNVWLSVFTGAAAAIQYGLLGLYLLSQPHSGPVDPLLSAFVNHGMRVAILLGSGVVAGIASLQIRRQFERALHSVEEQHRIIGMFGQHVSPAVVDRLLSQELELGGEVRHVCVMFLDIEGFTTFSESRSPEEVVEYLNSLFAVMIDDVNSHHGIVNKFLGDGFMAVFGAPITDPIDCRNAVAAALAIVKRIDAMSASGEIAPTRIRIGLHAGEAVTGNVGSAARKEYTIIGDVVNLASRLEQLNKQYGSRLLVSETVMQRLDRKPDHAIAHAGVAVKGRVQPVQVYELA